MSRIKSTEEPVPLVSVTIVTHNSEAYVDSCLDSVLSQCYRRLEVIVVDNASRDGTRQRLEKYRRRVLILVNGCNTGFAAGQNQAIEAGCGEWVLTLNPDVRLEPDFISLLVEAGGWDPRVGTVCGKLLRWLPAREGDAPERIDSTGIYFTPEFRHFDRGWNEPDDGRYDRPEYVFGASAAAALYRREMIRDVADADGFFDPDFFAYREDADVAWRAQLLGWRCLYVPQAVAHHVRRLVPGRRRSAPALLRMHSVKNRFLMRVKNVTGGLYRRFWWRATVRDLMVVAGCLIAEPRSLAGFWRLAQTLPRAIEKRRALMRRRQVSDQELASWFTPRPTARPFPEEVAVFGARLAPAGAVSRLRGD